jgi:hypothetical protein
VRVWAPRRRKENKMEMYKRMEDEEEHVGGGQENEQH